MGAQLGSKGTFSDINMTPLIDIVLVVLIIMMVNIPIQMEELGLTLPPPKVENPPPPDPNAEQLVIAVYEDGKIALNRMLANEEDMFGEITRRLRPMSKKNVFIDAHPTVNFGAVVDMMDLAKRAGAERVAFAKLKEGGPLVAEDVLSTSLPRGVVFGSPSTAGEMTEKRADEALAPLKPSMSGCYDAALAAAPGTKGQLVLQVDVGPEGELMATEVAVDKTGNAGLAACMDRALRGLKFEPLGEGKTARIRYPMLLTPGG